MNFRLTPKSWSSLFLCNHKETPVNRKQTAVVALIVVGPWNAVVS